MFVQSLQLENFRNFRSLDLTFNQGFIVLNGPNGAGKTNLLESIYFGGSLRRFPESGLDQLCRIGENYFRVVIATLNSDRNVHEVFAERQGAKQIYRLKLNNQTIQRSKYAGFLPIVSFLPQDLNLLTRSPGNRRRFLDEVLSFTSAEYRFSLFRFQAAVRQRNEFWENIKQGKADEGGLDIWDEKLVEYGSVITHERKNFLEHLNFNLRGIMDILSPKLSLGRFVFRNSGSENKQDFMEKVLQARARERVAGTTMVGPHRDDFDVFLEGRNAVGLISRGQMRSLTLALKILELKYLSEKLSVEPIAILDDVFSEFDQAHQMRLIEFLKSLRQVFLTTAHPEEIKKFLPAETQIYSIDNGKTV